MRVGLSFDLKETMAHEAGAPDDMLEEYDSPTTIGYIQRAIEGLGHTTVKLGGGPEFIRNVLNEKVDIVFNIAEGRGTYRSREAQVPSILEMLDIPYVGSDPECLAVCLDKHLTKKLLKMEGIPTPDWRLISNQQELNENVWKGFPFPAIVKPAYEGSSKGIHPNSLVDSMEQVYGTVSDMLELYRQQQQQQQQL